jgi:lincosamide nucleotidyltransferase A/C/D/E
MTLAQVLTVLDAVRRVGCRYWLEGGRGVDALAGRQTRPHRDLDLDIDGAFEADVLAALVDLGYASRPTGGPTGSSWLPPAEASSVALTQSIELVEIQPVDIAQLVRGAW